MIPLQADMRRVVQEQRLGFVATVDSDGSPNLSPKGTFAVLADGRLAFADIRSPNTTRNLLRDQRVEVNFVDPFARTGYRFRGRATVVDRDHPGFGDMVHQVVHTAALIERVRAIVAIEVDDAKPLTSPAYDAGSTEAELRALWTERFRAIQPGGRFLGER
jgi:predicted pyridoxine 5'-phosphate oxidase superfamily flavin-nucleotide-binding protein